LPIRSRIARTGCDGPDNAAGTTTGEGILSRTGEVIYPVEGTLGGSEGLFKHRCQGREVRALTSHADSVYSVAVTPDGKRAVSASRDQTPKVWDLASGHELRTLTGHSGPVNGVALTRDGLVVSASGSSVNESGDNTLKVWDLDSGREVTHPRWPRGFRHCGGGDAGRAARSLGFE
jgi:WD40 repeat protein